MKNIMKHFHIFSIYAGTAYLTASAYGIKAAGKVTVNATQSEGGKE